MRRTGRSFLQPSWHCQFVLNANTSRNFSSTTTSKGAAQHEEIVKKEFAQQAQRGYDNQAASSDAMMNWITSNLPTLSPSYRVLDVAAGTGRMSRAVANKVHEVVAVDITKEMMAVGAEMATKEGHKNIKWIPADARKIPFPDEEFDVVVSRLALHHWPQPQPIVNEMARLCKKGGKVIIVDIVYPEDVKGEERQRAHYLETLRDPSHATFVDIPKLQRYFTEASPKLQLVTEKRKIGGKYQSLPGIMDSRDNFVSVNQWLNVTNPDAVSRQFISQAIERELINGEPKTGMKPFRKDGGIYFVHHYVIIEADKI